MMDPAVIRAEGEAMLARHAREQRDLMMRQRAEVAAFCRGDGYVQQPATPYVEGTHYRGSCGSGER